MHNNIIWACLYWYTVCLCDCGYKCLNINNACKCRPIMRGQLDDHLLFWQPTISITLYVIVIALYLLFPYWDGNNVYMMMMMTTMTEVKLVECCVAPIGATCQPDLVACMLIRQANNCRIVVFCRALYFRGHKNNKFAQSNLGKGPRRGTGQYFDAPQIGPKSIPSRGPIPNPTTCLIPGPILPMMPNGIRIRSAVFPQCTGQTDRPTDNNNNNLSDSEWPLRFYFRLLGRSVLMSMHCGHRLH